MNKIDMLVLIIADLNSTPYLYLIIMEFEFLV